MLNSMQALDAVRLVFKLAEEQAKRGKRTKIERSAGKWRITIGTTRPT